MLGQPEPPVAQLLRMLRQLQRVPEGIRRRAARIYPAYLAALALVVAAVPGVAQSPAFAASALAHLVLLQGYVTPGGLAIIDCNQVDNPRLIGELGGFHNPRAVAVQFRYAFVTDDDGLKVVDISSLSHPRHVSGAFVQMKLDVAAKVYRPGEPFARGDEHAPAARFGACGDRAGNGSGAVGAVVADAAMSANIDDAIRECQVALKLLPNEPDAHVVLGNAFLAKDDLDRAGSEYMKALTARPDDANAHYNLGLVWQKKGDTGRANREFQTANELDQLQKR